MKRKQRLSKKTLFKPLLLEYEKGFLRLTWIKGNYWKGYSAKSSNQTLTFQQAKTYSGFEIQLNNNVL